MAQLGAEILKLPYVIEFPTSVGQVGIVHAEVPLGMSWQQFTSGIVEGDYTDDAIWQDRRNSKQIDEAVPGIDRIFVGHRIQYPAPRKLGNIFYIDTGAFKRVWADEYGEWMDDTDRYAFMTIVEATADATDIVMLNRTRSALNIRLAGPKP